jgi:hypothetical protein
MTKLPLPDSVLAFYDAHKTMIASLNHPRLKFTLDGRLLGDIGEFLIEHHYEMTPTTTRTPGVDGEASGRTVQVKATQSDTAGPAFSRGEGTAEHLIFVWLDFEGRHAHVIYDGPEKPVRAELPKEIKWTVRLNRERVKNLNTVVPDEQRLPRVR